MPITALPTPPQRSDPANFPARGDAFMTALPTFATEANALQTDVNSKQTAAATSATNAATSETNAATSATNAAASVTAATVAANAVVWVSGTTYAQNASVISPSDHKTYRRTSASGSGTTDPSADSANYILISVSFNIPAIKVSEQQTSGTAGGTATAADITQTRVFNTTDYNTISGASLSANAVTLPAGTYSVEAFSPLYSAGTAKIFLYNTTDSTYTVIGQSMGNNSQYYNAKLSGRFTIAGTKVFKVRYYISGAGGAGTNGLGAPTSSGQVEVYSEMEFLKLA